MRLRCPLPNRAKTDENKDNFLPPLAPPSTSRSNMSSMGTGKGVVGWKAPPKPARDSVVKQPTASQSESAKRLSQGLSVAHTRAAQRNLNNAQVTIGDVGTYSVVLDPQEMNGAPNPAMPPNPTMVQEGNGWPSTKAQRLYEESRTNRMRIEANRSSNGAVLRQQVFYFDASTASANENAALNAGLAADFAMAGIPQFPNNTPMGIQGSAYQGNNMGSGSIKGIHVKPQQPSIAKVTAMGVMGGNISSNASVGSNGGMPYPPSGINPNSINSQQRHQSMGGAGGTKQEELLRQLFPSWF